jgi:hypothetical protein
MREWKWVWIDRRSLVVKDYVTVGVRPNRRLPGTCSRLSIPLAAAGLAPRAGTGRVRTSRSFGLDEKAPRHRPRGFVEDRPQEAKTLVTFGSTGMPGPKVVETVAFWM